MPPTSWFLLVPVVALVLTCGRLLLSPTDIDASGRMTSPGFRKMEVGMKRPLLAPTWLPRHGRIGLRAPTVGARRILQDFSTPDGENLLILSQEPRSPARNAYHQRMFENRANAEIDLGEGRRGYFVRGNRGELRLFWNQGDTAVIVSSSVLTNLELAEIARRVR